RSRALIARGRLRVSRPSPPRARTRTVGSAASVTVATLPGRPPRAETWSGADAKPRHDATVRHISPRRRVVCDRMGEVLPRTRGFGMPEGQVLEYSGVTKRFGAVTAVSDFTARVEPGLVTGFLGPNGAGKT